MARISLLILHVVAVVNLDYRVLGLLENDHIHWFWIGPQAEYDELNTEVMNKPI